MSPTHSSHHSNTFSFLDELSLGYERVLPPEVQHYIGSGKTQQLERTNGIVRQQTGRWHRRQNKFSKRWDMTKITTRLVVSYNKMDLATSPTQNNCRTKSRISHSFLDLARAYHLSHITLMHYRIFSNSQIALILLSSISIRTVREVQNFFGRRSEIVRWCLRSIAELRLTGLSLFGKNSCSINQSCRKWVSFRENCAWARHNAKRFCGAWRSAPQVLVLPWWRRFCDETELTFLILIKRFKFDNNPQ